jgi:hypothetical protein
VLRYITNEPKLNVTEGSFEASYGTTAHGDPNSSLLAEVPQRPRVLEFKLSYKFAGQ